MPGILTFWLLLGAPGLWAARRLFPGLARGGLLALLPVAYLVSFSLLSPVSIAGYLLGAPLGVLTAAAVVLIGAGCAALGRDAWRGRHTLGVRLRAGFTRPGGWLEGLCACVLLGDLWLSALTGSHTGGDSMAHIGRVRVLLAHGFNNFDPLIAGPRLLAEYHTNLYHALIAVSAQLTGQQAFEAWLGVFAWAKLLAAASSYLLAWVLFERRLAAWLGALFTAVFLGPYSVLSYPNTLAPYFVFGLAIALAVELYVHGRTGRAALGLAALVLVASQLHLLYAIFVGLLLGPLWGVHMLGLWRRRDPALRRAVWFGLALGVALPFLWVARQPPDGPQPPTVGAYPQAATAPAPALTTAPGVVAATARVVPAGFVGVGADQIILDPANWTNLRSGYPYLLLLWVLGALRREGRAARVALGVLLVSFAVLYVPPVCTLLVKGAGAAWIVQRLVTLHAVCFNALLPGAVFTAGLAVLGRAGLGEGLAARTAAPLLALCATLYFAQRLGVDGVAWPRAAYLARFADTSDLQGRRAKLGAYHVVLARSARPGTTLWSEAGQATRMTALCDCYAFVTPEGIGSHGVEGMARRRRDAERLIDPAVPLATRVALLRHYGITQFFANKRAVAQRIKRAYGKLVVAEDREGPARVLTLDVGSSLRQ